MSKTAKECIAGVMLTYVPGSAGELTWQHYQQDEITIPDDLDIRSAKSVMHALQPTIFSRKDTVLHKRDGRPMIAAFGLESTGRVYLAIDPPIDIGSLRELNTGSLRGIPLHFVVSGDEFDTVTSDICLLVGSSWKDFHFEWFKLPLWDKIVVTVKSALHMGPKIP